MTTISAAPMLFLAKELENRDWEARWQLTLIEPAEREPAEDGLEMDPSPRTNIVVSRVPASEPSPRESVEKFLEQTFASVPGLAVAKPPAAIDFDDGVTGAELAIRFPVRPQVTLLQLHLFRHDGDVLTQFVITTDAPGSGTLGGERQARLDELRSLALRFPSEAPAS